MPNLNRKVFMLPSQKSVILIEEWKRLRQLVQVFLAAKSPQTPMLY